MHRKLLLVFAAIAVTVVLGLSSAYADTISLGDSCATNSISSTGSAPPTVTGSATGCTGQWEQNPTSTTLSWQITGGTGLTITGANSMTGTIKWSNAETTTDPVSGAAVLTLIGALTVTSVSGFSNEFKTNGVYPIDLTLRNGIISSGEIPPVPEPGTLTLLGTGLIAAAGFLRRKVVR
jgi:hypothetical protein